MFALREIKTTEDRNSVLGEVFSKLCSSHPDVFSEVERSFNPIDFTAKEHLVMPGNRCNHLYLICSGTAYGYYPGEHEEKVVGHSPINET